MLLTFAPQLWIGVDTLFGGDAHQHSLRAIDMWFSAAVLLLIGALSFFWVLSTRNEPLRGTVVYLRLHDPWRSLAWGVGLGFALLLAIVVVGLLMNLLGDPPENPALGDLQRILTWPLAITLSLAAALGEELLFRGLLQRWITVWGQAAVFGLLHAYQGVYGIVLTFVLALLFGFMVKRGRSLWIPIAAHFVFNLVQMAVLILAPEAA